MMNSHDVSKKLNLILKRCVLCPHKCRVDRTAGQKGFCSAGQYAFVSSSMPHHGEEPPISGERGSGTIFFSFCNMGCFYCQNYQISQEHEGVETTTEILAKKMLELQNAGCHNINLVSPTIWVPQIVEAVGLAKKEGLTLPVLYNTGGYDDYRIIKMLEGLIDIYMPDMRYSNNVMAQKYSCVKNYVENNRKAVKEMYRQVGKLKSGSNGIAKRGILIRLLVLPENIAGIKETLDFLKNEVSTDIYLSLMAQYHPVYRATDLRELSRRITQKEYMEIVEYAENLGFTNGWSQDYISLSPEKDQFIPDFDNRDVFKYYKK